MSVQYLTEVPWDPELIDVDFINASTAPAALQGLAKMAVKITTGAPAATAGKFIPGATILNAVSGLVYRNSGSTASPAWTPM